MIFWWLTAQNVTKSYYRSVVWSLVSHLWCKYVIPILIDKYFEHIIRWVIGVCHVSYEIQNKKRTLSSVTSDELSAGCVVRNLRTMKLSVHEYDMVEANWDTVEIVNLFCIFSFLQSLNIWGTQSTKIHIQTF